MSSGRHPLLRPGPPPLPSLQLPGDHRLVHADTQQDLKQVLRHLADAAPAVPHWRQQRPSLLVEGAEFVPADAAAGGAAATGTLLLRGYVRGAGLSANQAVHIAGAGDFQLRQVDGPPEPGAANEPGGGAARRAQHGAAVAAMDTAADGGALPVLARPDAEQQEPLTRENDLDPLAGEQTWPTEEVRGPVHGAMRRPPWGAGCEGLGEGASPNARCRRQPSPAGAASGKPG